MPAKAERGMKTPVWRKIPVPGDQDKNKDIETGISSAAE